MFKITSTASNGSATSTYFNGTPVGAGAENKVRADILLVQFFLRDFFLEQRQLFVALPKTKRKGNSVDVDGQVGGQTIEAIRIFQRVQKLQGASNFVDGRVSVAKGADIISGTRSFFTIVLLNFDFFGRPENAPFNAQLSTHPRLAVFAELQAALAQIDSIDV